MSIKLNSSTSFTSTNITSLSTLLSYTADKAYILGVRVDLGVSTYLLNSGASELVFKAYITSGSTLVQCYTKTVTKPDGDTKFSHNFDSPIVIAEDEVLTIKVSSNNVLDTTVAGNVYISSINADILNTTTAFTDKSVVTEGDLLTYTATEENTMLVRVDFGVGELVSAESEYTIRAKVTSTTNVYEAYRQTILKESGSTEIIHNFDKTIYLQDGEVLTITVESNDSNDVSISGNVYFVAYRKVGDYMDKKDIVEWLETEFFPLELATPTTTMYQLIDNAIRKWNTISAHKLTRVYTVNSSDYRVQLDTDYKAVVDVYPTTATTWIWQGHPVWSLLGFVVLDSVTNDMILMTEAYKNYQQYIGADFQWKYERSDNPNVGGYLYLVNMPRGASSICVVGTKRITSTEDIVDEHILNWILYYCKALLKQVEGNTLRKANIVDIRNDGEDLYREGKTEAEDLIEELAKNSRWVALARRI
jgi:hypothetical protein